MNNSVEMQHPIFEIDGRPKYAPGIAVVPYSLTLILAKLTEVANMLAGLPVTTPTTPGSPGTTPVVSDKIKHLSITNVQLPAANTEYVFTFPVGTQGFVMHARNGNIIRMSTEQGVVASDPAVQSNNPRFTLKANTVYSQDDLNISDFLQTFYFACGTAGEVLEIITGI